MSGQNSYSFNNQIPMVCGSGGRVVPAKTCADSKVSSFIVVTFWLMLWTALVATCTLVFVVSVCAQQRTITQAIEGYSLPDTKEKIEKLSDMARNLQIRTICLESKYKAAIGVVRALKGSKNSTFSGVPIEELVGSEMKIIDAECPNMESMTRFEPVLRRSE